MSRQRLRRELERQITGGRCVYCRTRASPDRPLTREHAIPLARGGKRKDLSIVVPACARCNHRRGCRDLSRFLLERPRRISAFLDHLVSLPADTLQQIDSRVFAELYAALWLLSESAAPDVGAEARLRHLCRGRRLHRRRYAARHLLEGTAGRIERIRRRRRAHAGASSPLPDPEPRPQGLPTEEPLPRLECRLVGLLAVVWGASGNEVREQLGREARTRATSSAPAPGGVLPFPCAEAFAADDSLPRSRRRRRRRRTRDDRRGGRAVRPKRTGRAVRARAA